MKKIFVIKDLISHTICESGPMYGDVEDLFNLGKGHSFTAEHNISE